MLNDSDDHSTSKKQIATPDPNLPKNGGHRPSKETIDLSAYPLPKSYSGSDAGASMSAAKIPGTSGDNVLLDQTLKQAESINNHSARPHSRGEVEALGSSIEPVEASAQATIVILDDDDSSVLLGNGQIAPKMSHHGMKRKRSYNLSQPISGQDEVEVEVISERERPLSSRSLIDGEDDIEVISALSTPPRSHLRNPMRKHASAINGYLPGQPARKPIDLDALPDRTEHSSSSHASKIGQGTYSQPIDVESYRSSGISNLAQHVNGIHVGSYQDGVYMPSIEAPTEQASPSDFGDGLDWMSNFQAALQSSLSGLGLGLPSSSFPSTGSAINTYSHSSMASYNKDRWVYRPRHRDESQQSQMSCDDLKKLIENIKDSHIPPEQRVKDPVGLTKPLMAHQKIGLTWMKSAEEQSNRGGILADAMGLGKTIQAISLILARPASDSRKSTLVVAPVALLRQWEREIVTMTSPTPSIYIHHGSKKLTSAQELSQFDIVLTSFNTVGYEEGIRTRREEQLHNQNSFEAPKCPIADVEWFRIILDEAHFIKNKLTKAAVGCGKLKATHRWALTGTPMQNSLDELFSLISFLRIKPYNDHKLFVRDIAKPLSQKDTESLAQATKKIQALLSAIMLRRTKDSQIDGKAILHLPTKHSMIDYVTMGDEERARYVELEAGAQKTLQRAMQHDKASTGANMLVLLLKLRQTCDHSLLSGIQEEDVTILSNSAGLKLAKDLRPEVVARLKNAAAEGFECPVCLDIALSGISIIVPCGHYYCGECLIQQLDLNSLSNNGEESANCPQCRCSFDLKKCISLKHFQKVHCPEMYEDPDDCMSSAADDDFKSSVSSEMDRKPKLTLNVRDKGKGKQKVRGPRGQSTADRFYGKYHMKMSEFTQSAKIQMIQSLINDVRKDRPGEKIIVFSQFTAFLDLIEIPLHQTGIEFLRYDGSLDAGKRNDALIKFETDPNYNVILVSLKAGNVGLNLTCANHVILSEPFWNPYVETQSEDRAHRIGQKREVFVRRLIIKDSVESRVLAIQEKKRALIEGAMDPAQSAAITKLDKREIAYLFGFNNGAA